MIQVMKRVEKQCMQVFQGICANKEVGNLGLDLRCLVFAATVIKSSGTFEVLTVDLEDPTESQKRIYAVQTKNYEVNGLLTVGLTIFYYV